MLGGATGKHEAEDKLIPNKFTLRNVTECHEAGPGYWMPAEGGFPMYVRTAK